MTVGSHQTCSVFLHKAVSIIIRLLVIWVPVRSFTTLEYNENACVWNIHVNWWYHSGNEKIRTLIWFHSQIQSNHQLSQQISLPATNTLGCARQPQQISEFKVGRDYQSSDDWDDKKFFSSNFINVFFSELKKGKYFSQSSIVKSK